MATLEVTASATVAAPAEQVWELLCDTSRYADWVDGTDEVTRTDGPAQPGSTYDEVNPIMGPWKARSRWTVTEFDPPRSQTHSGEGFPLTKEFSVVMAVAPVDDSTSEVTITLRGASSGGPLGSLQYALLKGQVDRDNKKTVENFAALAARELQPASTP